ncbi:MAG TPA: hypothetical protein VMT43_14310 [Acidimicrobiales bacterium]|nr:hypothetical protein [Acidimicrobiales bacterium]
MIHDPALALHTIKQSQQEHRDIADAHRLARTGSADGRQAGRARRSFRSTWRLPRLRRPAAPPVGLPGRLSTS